MADYSTLDLSAYLSSHTVKETVDYFSKKYKVSKNSVKAQTKLIGKHGTFKTVKKSVSRNLRLGKLQHYADNLITTGINQAGMQKILRSAGVKFTDADLRNYLHERNYTASDVQWKSDGTPSYFIPHDLAQYPRQYDANGYFRKYRYVITAIWESSDHDIIGVQLGENYKVDRLNYPSDKVLTKSQLVNEYKRIRAKQYRHLTTKSGWSLKDITVVAYVDSYYHALVNSSLH